MKEKQLAQLIGTIWESPIPKECKVENTEKLIKKHILAILHEQHREALLKAGPEIFIYPEKYVEFVENTKEIRSLIENITKN